MPDIEWYIVDETRPETVIRTPQRKPPRWRRLAILFVVAIGIGLGLAYRSIPEPPALKPQPTRIPPATVPPFSNPTPTPLPSVTDTIEREAQALARGDLPQFMRLQDPSDHAWLERQASPEVFNTWGMPQTGALYTIVESGTLPNNRVWADIIQFRNGPLFRETRFYREQNNQWVRIRPVTDGAFWGGWQTVKVGSFSVTFSARDTLFTPLIALRLEQAYQHICRDLRCAENPDPAVASQINYRVILSGDMWTVDRKVDLALPSPHNAGLYMPASDRDLSDQTNPFEQLIYRFLVNDLVSRIVYHHFTSSSSATAASMWAHVITNWELTRLRIMSEIPMDWVYLRNPDIPTLESLWNPSSVEDARLSTLELAAFVKFIDERYGSDKVARLLNEVNVAPTLPDAIKKLGLSYDDLKHQWNSWIKQLVESQS